MGGRINHWQGTRWDNSATIKIGKISMESYKTEYTRKKLRGAFNGKSRLVFIEFICKIVST
jgi:hypothetical protein